MPVDLDRSAAQSEFNTLIAPAHADHSQVGASTCERWWNCPGSNGLIASLPMAAPTKYAAEGTLAHKICEGGLATMINHPNNAICTCTGAIGKEEEIDGFLIERTEEMALGAQLYQNTIKEDAKRIGCVDKLGHIVKEWVNIEQSFKLDDVDSEARGTNDASIYVPGKTLIVYDYKFGRGVPVEAVENKQMLYYAIGAAGDKLMEFESIELVIVQPRAEHPQGPVRRWVTTPQYVNTFKQELGKRIRNTRVSNATETGKWCRFCNAKMICPATRTKVNELAKVDFQEPVKPNALKTPDRLTPIELKTLLDNADLSGLKEIIKEAIRNKWGNNPPKNLRMPLRSGNESDLDKYPEDKDKIIANAKRVAYPPGLIDAKTKQEILDPKEFYSGCYARASLVCYAYDNKSKGVAFGLQNLLKIKDGEPLVNRASAESDFAGIIDTVQDEVGADTTDIDDDILGDLNA